MPDTLVNKSQDASSPVIEQKQVQKEEVNATDSPSIAVEASKEDLKDASSSPQLRGNNQREKAAGQAVEEEADGSDDGKAASEKEQAEHLRRKRDREGSLEPSLSSQSMTTDLNPSKKNRLQDAVIREEQVASSSIVAAPSSPNLKGGEGEKVGQIRKRVQDLSWKQRKEGDRDGHEEEEEEDGKGEGDGKELPGQNELEDEKSKPEPSSAPVQEEAEVKRAQPSFSSFSSKSSGFAAAGAAKDKGNFLSSPPASDSGKTGTASPPSASRTQPTFSSFSKSSSPFSSASNVAGPSWLAGKSGSGVTSTASPGQSGGIKPSTLGSVGNAVERESPAAASPAASASEVTNSKGTTEGGSLVKNHLGFGAFASSKTFSSKGSSPASVSDKGKDGTEEGEEKPQRKTFDEVLQESEERNGEAAEKPSSKAGSHFDGGQVDLRTGEEDERTLTSARAKLYTMSEDKNWKERGTGTVRCNVGKEGGGGGRLVMRSEGVLRLILNVNLFKGMKINLEQDKFLRIVAMEEEKLAHFAIKFANQAAATNFYRVVKQTIPAEDGDSWA